MKRYVFTILCPAILLCSTASNSALVRVGIFRVTRPDTVMVSCPTGLRLEVGGARARTAGRSHSVGVSLQGGSLSVDIDGNMRRARSVTVSGIGGHPVDLRSGVHIGRYRGAIRVSHTRGSMRIVNTLPLEGYVRGVVPNEMRSDWHSEALRTQAVVARTLALERMGSHAYEGFDLCDTTHCQVYRGALNETPETDAATVSTAGLVLMCGDRPINAFYCSTCGGATTGSMGGRPAGGNYLPSRVDTLNGRVACADSPHFRWSRRISSSDLTKALASDKRTRIGGVVSNLTVVSRDKSGRASAVRIDGRKPVSCDGYVFWNTVCRNLGWASLKSAAFTVARSGDSFEFKGRGLGHGIGMCQWGAKKRADSGWDSRRILGFYYPGTRLHKIDQASK